MPRALWELALVLLLLVGTDGVRASNLVLEIRARTSDAPDASQVFYFCDGCTVSQFDELVPPDGFEKAPPKIAIPSSVEPTPLPPPFGFPPSMDLLPEVVGDEFRFVAEVQPSVTVIGPAPSGLEAFTVSEVERQTVFVYDSGEVAHVVSDTNGDEYILQTYAIELIQQFDPTVVGGLSGLPLPEGWTYSSYRLEEALIADSGGLARVFSIGEVANWQRLDPIPEPASCLLLCLGLLAAGFCSGPALEPEAPRAHTGV